MDNPPEKVDNCPLNIVVVQLGQQKLSVIWSNWVSTIQWLLKYKSEWEDNRDFQNCLLYCGCPLLRGVR